MKYPILVSVDQVGSKDSDNRHDKHKIKHTGVSVDQVGSKDSDEPARKYPSDLNASVR